MVVLSIKWNVCAFTDYKDKIMLLLHFFVLDLVLLILTLYSLKDMVEVEGFKYHCH